VENPAGSRADTCGSEGVNDGVALSGLVVDVGAEFDAAGEVGV
jgi:hypothetical protein